MSDRKLSELSVSDLDERYIQKNEYLIDLSKINIKLEKLNSNLSIIKWCLVTTTSAFIVGIVGAILKLIIK